MASPDVVAAAGAGQLTSAGTTLTIVYTSGGTTAGNLAVVIARFAGAPGTVTATGYTQLASDTSDASDDQTMVFYRWTDGTEGVSDDITFVNSVKGCSLNFEISGAVHPSSSVPAISTVAVGTTTANTCNPGTVSVPSGPDDVIYIALGGCDGEGTGFTGAPTNYINLAATNSGTGGAVATNCLVGGATRRLTASSSDDPGVFTHGAANAGWTAFTVVVRSTAPAVAFQPRPSGTVINDPAVLMRGIRRAWHRRRSGIFVPDIEGVFV